MAAATTKMRRSTGGRVGAGETVSRPPASPVGLRSTVMAGCMLAPSGSTVPPVSGSERMASLRTARDLMDLRYAEPLDLDRMAGEAGFSKFHFARAFKDAYGETPANYLTRRRVERAKDLLRLANLTVTEVCMLVGCSSLGSFSSRFSELVGMSPSAFQRASAARGGPPPIPGCFLMDWSRPRPSAPRQESNLGEA
jgi:AraC-like DNA-binding protein